MNPFDDPTLVVQGDDDWRSDDSQSLASGSRRGSLSDWHEDFQPVRLSARCMVNNLVQQLALYPKTATRRFTVMHTQTRREFVLLDENKQMALSAYRRMDGIKSFVPSSNFVISYPRLPGGAPVVWPPVSGFKLKHLASNSVHGSSYVLYDNGGGSLKKAAKNHRTPRRELALITAKHAMGKHGSYALTMPKGEPVDAAVGFTLAERQATGLDHGLLQFASRTLSDEQVCAMDLASVHAGKMAEVVESSSNVMLCSMQDPERTAACLAAAKHAYSHSLSVVVDCEQIPAVVMFAVCIVALD